jgi:hypothetical protein
MSIHDAPAEKRAVIDRVGNRRDVISGQSVARLAWLPTVAVDTDF